jgi:hypothetical protein
MRELWQGRSALHLSNGVVEAVLLPGGGHIAEFHFTADSGHPQQNMMWQPSWQTADPESDKYAALVSQYGDKATGRFLAAYTGHALCLDGFGPPSAAEACTGVGLHGEAATAMWEFVSDDTNCIANGIAELPVARLRVERRFHLQPNENILFVDERVHNLSNASRNLHWVQHATFGPPFLASSISTVNASVTNGISWPHGYEGHALLPDDAFFSWPQAQTVHGNGIDLREPFTQPGYGFVAAVQQDPLRTFSFIAALNSSLGLAVGYCFRRDVFPWLTLWEENLVRTYSPWNGKEQARGMEFGTTPLPLGKDETAKRGSLFGQPTARQIGPFGTLYAPWLMFLAPVPCSWHTIEDVRIEEDQIVLIEGHHSQAISARGVANFLEATSAETIEVIVT